MFRTSIQSASSELDASRRLLSLEPRHVWRRFSELLDIPRPSLNEHDVAIYLCGVAESHGWMHKIDRAGNVIIDVPGRGAGAGAGRVLLQAHMDMICLSADPAFDFLTRRIPIEIAGEDGQEIVRAPGTTLGADNRGGVSIAVAVAEDETLTDCPPLRLIFTVDEEDGMTGVEGLCPGDLDVEWAISLDHDRENQICISSASSRNLDATWKIGRAAPEMDRTAFAIDLSGLPGGHSGEFIHEKRGNSLLLLAGLAAALKERSPSIQIASLDGGEVRNAIPSASRLTIWAAACDSPLLESQALMGLLAAEAAETVDPRFLASLKMSASPMQTALSPLTDFSATQVLDGIRMIPSRALEWSREVPGLVSLSNNIGIAVTTYEKVTVKCLGRAEKPGQIECAQATLAEQLMKAGAKVELGAACPPWFPEPNNPLLARTRAVFQAAFGKEPEVRGFHWGLECAGLKEKNPAIAIVAIGPLCSGCHEIGESISVPSVRKTYGAIKRLLESLAGDPL